MCCNALYGCIKKFNETIDALPERIIKVRKDASKKRLEIKKLKEKEDVLKTEKEAWLEKEKENSNETLMGRILTAISGINTKITQICDLSSLFLDIIAAI